VPADTAVSAQAPSAGVFTPMRTMVIVAIIAVGAATGAGRAAAARASD
jgi:hypothetical protein